MPSARRSKRRVMKWARSFSSSSRQGSITMPHGPGHQPVGEFDPAVALGRAEAVVPDPVQLQEPVLVALGRGQLARADLAGLGVEAHHRLGPGAAGRGADLDELGQCLERGVVAGELPPHGTAGGHHQVGQLQRGGVLGRHLGRGHVLERPHAPVGHVGQTDRGR